MPQCYRPIALEAVPPSVIAALELPFPQAAGFESFGDYEKALLDWQSSVTNALDGIVLPEPIGGSLRRPRVTNGIEELDLPGDGDLGDFLENLDMDVAGEEDMTEKE